MCLVTAFNIKLDLHKQNFLCVCLPQAISVQAGIWFLGAAVRGGTRLSPDIWNRVLSSASASPAQQCDQTTVYLQQASPVLQLEVHSPVCVTPHAHPGPAAHIRYRWVARHDQHVSFKLCFWCCWNNAKFLKWGEEDLSKKWLVNSRRGKKAQESQLCFNTRKRLQASKGTGTKKESTKRKRRSIRIKVALLKSRHFCFEGVGF